MFDPASDIVEVGLLLFNNLRPLLDQMKLLSVESSLILLVPLSLSPNLLQQFSFILYAFLDRFLVFLDEIRDESHLFQVLIPSIILYSQGFLLHVEQFSIIRQPVRLL